MSERREAIIQAAQALFLERGYAGTTIADVRARSGASIGSIYHAFSGKEALAVAILHRSLTGWTDQTRNVVTDASAETLVRSSVAGLLTWGSTDPAAFRVMDLLRGAAETESAGEIVSYLEEARLQSRDALVSQMEAGVLRTIPWQAAQALILGPAYEFLRVTQRFPSDDELETTMQLFGDAAWHAVAPTG